MRPAHHTDNDDHRPPARSRPPNPGRAVTSVRSGSAPISTPRRGGDRTESPYTATNPDEQHPAHPRTRVTRVAPHPDVVAAAEFLLAEPDAHLYRRRYLDLITHTPRPGGTTLTDYTAAEQYLLTTAARRRKVLQRPTTLHAQHTPKPREWEEDSDKVEQS